MSIRKNWKLYLLSFIAVLVFFQLNMGLRIVIPTNVSWLMTIKTDWNTHYLGWFFYRNEPWQFPLGKVSNYFYPVGTNVGFTDSIPLMAIFFKLFSPILPGDFQYFGLWLLVCRLLIAWYTIKICRLFNLRPILLFIAVIFMTQNPVLLYRNMHPALCAHWLFLGSAYLYLLDPSRVKPARIFRGQLVLLLLSALITPYLLVIEFGFTLIICWKHLAYDKSVDWKFAVRHLVVSLVAGAGIWLVVGMLTFGNKEHLAINGGFGKLSMNLNAFFDPSIWSSFLPELKRISIMQYEGYMYLGVGIFLLILVYLFYRVARSAGWKTVAPDGKAVTADGKAPAPAPRIVWAPLLTLSAVLAFAAITNVVTFNDKVLFTIPVPAIVTNTGDIFRASGRLFWPVYYLILFALLISLSRTGWPEGWKAGILGVALLIQLYDIKFLLTFQHLTYGAYEPPISKQWDGIIRPFNKVLMYPPLQTDYVTNQDYQYFAFIAARQKKPFDAGYVARADNNQMKQYIDSMEVHLQEGSIDTGALYITNPDQLQKFGQALETDRLQVNSLDGYYYLYDTHHSFGDLMPGGDSAVASAARFRDSVLAAFRSGKTEFRSTDSLGAGSDTLAMNVESAVPAKGVLSMSGWCCLKRKMNNKGDSLFAIIKTDRKSYIAPLVLQSRPDITAFMKAKYLDDAGFHGTIFEGQVEKGVYKLGVAVKEKNGKFFYRWSDREVKIE